MADLILDQTNILVLWLCSIADQCTALQVNAPFIDTACERCYEMFIVQ